MATRKLIREVTDMLGWREDGIGYPMRGNNRNSLLARVKQKAERRT